MHYILISIITLIFAVSSWPLLERLASYWESGDNSYCYFVLPLFVYLLWEQRTKFRFGETVWSSRGVPVVFLSLCAILVGELASVITLIFAGIWGCMAGVLIVLYGSRIKALFFPMLLSVFIIPLPPFINNFLTFKLKLAASTTAVKLLRLSGLSVLQEGNIIDLGVQKLQVVDACSGLRFFMPMLLSALLIGFFFNRRWWSKTVLVLLVLPSSVIFNAVRIWGTGMLIHLGYTRLAESVFHDFSGWLTFMMSALFIYIVAMILKRFEPKKPDTKKAEKGMTRKPKIPVRGMRPVVLSLLVSLLFIGNGWAVKQIPKSNRIPERKAFSAFPMQLGGWQGDNHTLSDEILDGLWADDYVTATFTREDLPNPLNLLVPYYEYQSTYHTAHAPQACMLGSGWSLSDSTDRTLTIGGNSPMPIRTMLWRKGDATVLGSYFFYQRGQAYTDPWMNKIYLIKDAFLKRRTDGALVRIEIVLLPGQGIDEGLPILEDFMNELMRVLPEHVPV